MPAPTSDDINRWIVRASLDGADAPAILAGVCERLVAAGVPLMRAALAGDMLDPSFDSIGVRWSKRDGASEAPFLRTPNATLDEEWLKSPFYALVKCPDDRLRRRLGADYREGEFPVLDEFRAKGGTDYLGMIVRLGESMWLGDTRGVVTSWLADAPAGFTDQAIELIAPTLPPLATAFLWRSMQRSARTLMTTYLGSDAAERVLAGNVVRGRAECIRAVVWYSDLVGFTRIADAQRSQVVLAMLNDYAGALVESIEAHGGHVLKFIGDGMLAIFPDRDESNACERALDAAAEARRRLEALNAARREAGLPVSDADIALHIGELLYGNVGSPRRLDFTVLGAAVNEAARIEALCASLDQRVIVSSAFVQAGGEAVRARLVSLGRYALKGVARPQELFTLEPA
ncbi:MAG: adenylate/guanylate cyclase domain-containing protein [Betaproteobacteria bacterium]|jgi:adenylate cyclase|nr:adenylate/guanylate cyclase domain-containing protein [Betaproteobacteria bacterium]MDH5287253.1 adenylate/guanylate cyclase domain-containing protein [Betaproteobacteria bacterium]